MLRHYINHPRNYEQLSLVGVKVGTGAINNEQGLPDHTDHGAVK